MTFEQIEYGKDNSCNASLARSVTRFPPPPCELCNELAQVCTQRTAGGLKIDEFSISQTPLARYFSKESHATDGARDET